MVSYSFLLGAIRARRGYEKEDRPIAARRVKGRPVTESL